MRNYLGILIFFMAAVRLPANAQGHRSYGILPEISITWSLPQSWKLNTALESRQIFFEGTEDKPVRSGYRYERTDVTIMLGRKTGVRSSIAGGYMARWEDNRLIQRLKQQYSVVFKYYKFRLGHRFAADQTFSAEEKPEYRFRYRAASEIPLNGVTINPNEYYLTLNNEYLGSVQDAAFDLEIRLSGAIGLNITEKNKIEAGAEYRISEMPAGKPEEQVWLILSWSVSI